MRIGKMLKAGDVVLTKIQFTDTFEVKTRPALVLFEEFDNVVAAGITSNKSMKGISLSKKDGAIKDSDIKLNYIFTVSKQIMANNITAIQVHENEKIQKRDLIIEGCKEMAEDSLKINKEWEATDSRLDWEW